MASAIAISPSVKPPVQLGFVPSQPVKFDSHFLERRMREHRQWQHRVAEQTTREILAEIAGALDCETGRGPYFAPTGRNLDPAPISAKMVRLR
jgi:hypothetical protein